MTSRGTTTDSHAVGRVEFRDTVRETDVQAVRNIVASSGFFASHEIDIAVELVEAHLARGTDSGYHFVFADADGCPIAYACYGPIGCTVGSFDLYWIAVRAASRGHGLGRHLLREVERRVILAGGRRLYVETSSRPLYEPTRRFYERCGYSAEARLADFYSPGDAKVVYVKPVDMTSTPEDCGDGNVEQPVT
ncbi:MAG: GNAT family N-acetyltransferase [Phycisphaerae bacterium]|nr:GNAT family N-acetyltransferase [Phycisphaerae bacterium]